MALFQELPCIYESRERERERERGALDDDNGMMIRSMDYAINDPRKSDAHLMVHGDEESIRRSC